MPISAFYEMIYMNSWFAQELLSIMTDTDKKLLKDLSLMLVVKLALLFIIWYLFFSTPTPPNDASDITAPRQAPLEGESP
jgi:hypothetical protein